MSEEGETHAHQKFLPEKPQNKVNFFFFNFFLVTGTDLQKQKGPHMIFRQQINLSELAVRQMEEI